jgi:hypothetical protein
MLEKPTPRYCEKFLTRKIPEKVITDNFQDCLNYMIQDYVANVHRENIV